MPLKCCDKFALQEEKLHIAIRHLVPKQLAEHGLDPEMMQLPDESIQVLSKNLINKKLL